MKGEIIYNPVSQMYEIRDRNGFKVFESRDRMTIERAQSELYLVPMPPKEG